MQYIYNMAYIWTKLVNFSPHNQRTLTKYFYPHNTIEVSKTLKGYESAQSREDCIYQNGDFKPSKWVNEYWYETMEYYLNIR